MAVLSFIPFEGVTRRALGLVPARLVGVAFVGLAFLAPGAAASIEVVSSSADQFEFVVEMGPSDLLRQSVSDSSSRWYYPVKIGVPHGARVELRLAEGSALEPVSTKSGLPVSQAQDRSKPLAEISQPFTVRHRRLAEVRIYPLAGDLMYRRMRVRLAFIGASGELLAGLSDPHFDRIFGSVVANYGQVRTWPVPTEEWSKTASPQSFLFDGSADWYKISVRRSGLCKLSGAQLQQAGLYLSNISNDSLRLFSGGGLPLPLSNDSARPEPREVACLVRDDGDGVLEADDYLLFYAEGPDRWLYQPGERAQFMNNVYSDCNVYWLAVSGDFEQPPKRMAEIEASPTGGYDTLVTTYRARIHLQQDNVQRAFYSNVIVDYYNWYWTDDSNLAFSVTTPGYVPGDTADVWLWGLTGDTTGSSDRIGYMDLVVNGVNGFDKSCSDTLCTFRTASLVTGLNDFSLLLWPSVHSAPYFDFVEAAYGSSLTPENDRIDFCLGQISGRAGMEIVDAFSEPPLVLDLSDPLRPSSLVGYERSLGTLAFAAELGMDSVNRFLVATEGSAFSPASVKLAEPANLRDVSRQVDVFVVTPGTFTDDMIEWEAIGEARGLSVRIVAVEDIMDNFSWGLYDPLAIRDFLKFSYEHYPQPAPSGVLLVGDSNYDFLNHLETGVPNYVPPCVLPDDNSISDDNYVYFGKYGLLDGDTSYVPGDRGYDMLVARWPVRSSSEISAIIAKIRSYTEPDALGPWRSRVGLVADDEFGTYDSETFHVEDTEILEQHHLPRQFLRKKIYLWEYPFVGRRKPEVNDEIIRTLNDEGVLLMNFVGHGNPDVWAHEHVFHRLRDLPRLANFDRLPLIYVASCANGFFDDPKRDGMGEALLAHPGGGAIATVSATRLVYATENASFNRAVFDMLFSEGPLGMGEAFYAAKLRRQYVGQYPSPVINDRAYLYFGDPYLPLGKPQLEVEFLETPDSLVALKATVVSGRVVDAQGATFVGDGRLLIRVFDSDMNRSHYDVDYKVTGPAIYRGSATINGGEFSFQFLPSLDISYGGSEARVLAYAMFDRVDGLGLADSIPVSGQVAQVTDSVGPDISLALSGGREFVSGDVVARDDRLEVTISDLSGINLTSGLGHGITLEVDDDPAGTVSLTGLYEFAQDDYTTGRLLYPLSDLETGRHRFRIKAWDNANNSSSLAFAAEIVGDNQLVIRDLLNYPNPMQDSTRFSLLLTAPVRHLMLEVFTLAGRRIWDFRVRRSLPAGYFDDIVWYGRDSYTHDRVATGVYVYKATAESAIGGEPAESFGKVVVIN